MRKYVASRPPPVQTGTRTGPRKLAYHKPVPRHRSILGRILTVVLLVAALLTLALLGYKMCVDTQTSSLMYSYDDPKLPSNHVALVFGAGLNQAGEPSAILYDRVATAADIYKAGQSAEAAHDWRQQRR